MPNRTVLHFTDGTGITAETFGKVATGEITSRHIAIAVYGWSTKPTKQFGRSITQESSVAPNPLCSPLVSLEVLEVITHREGCQGMLLDMFGTFVHHRGTGSSEVEPPRFSDASESRNTSPHQAISSRWFMMTGNQIET
jgi:regulator of PEP synthase PpsR (kinase-PPPase family)